MTTITYQFNPGDICWNVNPKQGVNQCVVQKVVITIAVPAVVQIQYNIQFCNPGIQSATVNEGTLFPDINSALTAYGQLQESIGLGFCSPFVPTP